MSYLTMCSTTLVFAGLVENLILCHLQLMFLETKEPLQSFQARWPKNPRSQRNYFLSGPQQTKRGSRGLSSFILRTSLGYKLLMKKSKTLGIWHILSALDVARYVGNHVQLPGLLNICSRSWRRACPRLFDQETPAKLDMSLRAKEHSGTPWVES